MSEATEASPPVDLPDRALRAAVFAVPLVTLAGVFPWGWDTGSPIRWFLVPAFGFGLVALVALQPSGATDDTPLRTFTTGGSSSAELRPGIAQAGPSWLELAWVGLVGWGLVATVLAADPLHAWIGTPDRRLGWSAWVLFAALFWAGLRLRPSYQAVLLRGVVVGSIGMSLITLAERLGWGVTAGFVGSRLGGPFGQPAYLGAAAALAAPICIGLAVHKRKTDRRRSSQVWRLVAGCSAFLTVGTLLAAQARAAWLGAFTAGLLVAAVRKPARPSLILPIGVPLVAVLGTPELQRRLSSAGGDAGVVAGRWDEWRVGLEALTSSPVVGYGPEGYRTVFGLYVDEAYAMRWGREVITDRAHNGLLDTALAFGVPGSALLAAIMGLVLWRCRTLMVHGDASSAGLAVGVTAALVGQQFLFPLSELDPLLWLLAGTALAPKQEPELAPKQEPELAPSEQAVLGPDGQAGPMTDVDSQPGIGHRVLAGIAAGLAVVAAVAGLADLLADRSIVSVTSIEPTAGMPTQPDRALTLRPDSIRYRFIAARLAAGTGDLVLAQQRIDEGLERSPTDPALRAEQATLALRRAEDAQRAAGGPTTDTVEAAEVAVTALSEALTTDPLRPDLLNQLGFAHLLAGRPDLALEPLQQSLRLDPDNQFAQDNLATAERIIAQAETGPQTDP